MTNYEILIFNFKLQQQISILYLKNNLNREVRKKH